MLNDWFKNVEFPLTRAQFDQLPRHPAYRYEYARGRAVISPVPRYGRALLDLNQPPTQASTSRHEHGGPIEIRSLQAGDWDLLPGLMAASFRAVPPFSSLDETAVLTAAADCLRTTRNGGDGPVVHTACLVAVGTEPWENPVGAVLITLIPREDLTEWHSTRWKEPPPADSVERCLGRPHLTWIFVSPWHSGHGLGSALLHHAGDQLRRLGYSELASTLLIGNERATAWHWRNGFQLLRHPGSARKT